MTTIAPGTGIHVVTTLADSYAPVRMQDVVIPFVSAYRPLWGLGAVACPVACCLGTGSDTVPKH